MNMKLMAAGVATLGAILVYVQAPQAHAIAYAGNGVAYAGADIGYPSYPYEQPIAMPYGGGYGGQHYGGAGYYPEPQSFYFSPSTILQPMTHYNPTQQYAPQVSYPYPGGYGYGNYGSGYGSNYGTGYGPYLPSYPKYDPSFAPYSNYYRAYPQVPHYMTGDTNLWGQQLCRWANYPGANMPCDWDPQQPVYDAWTGTYY